MKFVFTHTQPESDPQDTWNVYHNLGVMYPIAEIIVVIDSVKVKIIPHAIEPVDENFLRVKFTKPFYGTGRFI